MKSELELWYMQNDELHRELQIETVKEEIPKKC